jgi:predicted dehydrogenase
LKAIERITLQHKEYGVLIIGAGWVSTQHISAYKRNPRTQIHAVCNIHPAKARQRVAEAGLADVAIYGDTAEALRHEGIDIVSVCTPQHIHCQNVLAAADAGKHMVIEKPVANSLSELRQMRDAVRRAGVKTVVSFVLRWNPLFQEIKRIIAAGTLGEIFCVETDYQSYNSAWWSGWEQGRRKDLSVSAMAVAGCHAVDAMRWFAADGQYDAAEPLEVFAYAGGKRKGKTLQFDPLACEWSGQSPMEYDGLEMVLAKLTGGVLGKVSVNFEAIQPYAFHLQIFGDRGTIRGNRLFAPSIGGNQWVDIPGVCPDSSDVTHHPFQGEIDHFIDCLASDRVSHCNLDDAIKTHEVVFAAQQCYETGRPVALPLL